MSTLDIERVEREWSAREIARKESEEAERRRGAAAHKKACMEYDDAFAARPQLRWRDRRFLCKWLAVHSNRWNPRWINGCYGFCTKCGASTGGGINEMGGY